MTRNVILDFGNVLGTFDKLTACENLAEYAENLTGQQIYTLIVGNELEESLEMSAIDNQTFAKRLTSTIGAVNLPEEKCLEIWGDIFKQNTEITPLLKDLKNRDIGMAVLSDSNGVHWPYVRKLDVIKLLESWGVPFILSYEVHVLKPETKMYVAALSALGCKAEEAVSVDDTPENVEAARQLGMTGVDYDCSKQSVNILQDSLSHILA